MTPAKNSLTRILENVNSTSCPFSLNFHCHTTCSDGSLEPIELFKQANEIGLKHLSITDHHSVKAYKLIKAYIETQSIAQINTKLWAGIEISCLLNKCLVHVLGYGFDIDSRCLKQYTLGDSPNGSYLQAETVVKALHDSGGLVVLAHPARYRIDFKHLINAANEIGFDGIEVWYDYHLSPKWAASEFICQKIDILRKSLNLLATCGTDTHGIDLLGR